MPIAEDIGGVAVSITGDLTDLQAAFTDAQALAEKSGTETASAFTEAASGADVLTGSVTGLTSVLGETGAAVDSAAASVGDTSGVFNDAAGAADNYSESAARIADSLKDIPPAADDAKAATGDLVTTLLEIAGVGVSIAATKEMLTSMVEVFSTVERAQEAFSMIRGSAEAGAIAIERLKDMAQELALPFDALVPIAQKMAAMQMSVEQTERALRTTADASRYSGVSFEIASAAMLRMAEAGTVSGRFLIQLGTNMDDLAAVMTVKSGEVQNAFHRATAVDRWEFLEEALAKTRGAAAKTADDTAGSMTRMANEWKSGLEQMGEGLAPIVHAVHEFGQDLQHFFAVLMIGWDELGPHAKAVGEIINGVFTITHGAAIGSASLIAQGTVAINAGLTAYKAADDEMKARIKDLTSLEHTHAGATDDAAAAAKRHADALRDLANAANAASLKKAQEEFAAFDNSVKVLFDGLPAVYSDYVTKLEDGGKTAQSMLASVQEDIDKASALMTTMKGAPLAAMEEWRAKLQGVQGTLQEFADTDAWTKAAVGMKTLFLEHPEQISELSGQFGDILGSIQHLADAAPAAFTKADPLKLVANLVNEQTKLDESGKEITKTFENAWDTYAKGSQKATEASIELNTGLNANKILAGTVMQTYLEMAEGMQKAGLTTVTVQQGAIEELQRTLTQMNQLHAPLIQRLELEAQILQAQIALKEAERTEDNHRKNT